MNFYKHWLGDYQRDTADLSLMEHGAYRLLLDTYYATEEPFPAELQRIYRTARAVTPEEQEAVRLVVDRFFPIGEDGLRRNKRADAEIAATKKYSEQQRQHAKKRWQGEGDANPDANTHANPDGSALPTHMPNAWVSDASHSHSQSIYNDNDDDNASVLKFGHEAQQAAYDGYRRASRLPAAFDASLKTLLEPISGGKPCTIEQLGAALLELAGNGEAFNLSRLRGYLRKAEQGAPADIPRGPTGYTSATFRASDDARRKLGLPPREPVQL